MKSFLMYIHLKPIIDQLSDKQAGLLIKAIYLYESDKEEKDIKLKDNVFPKGLDEATKLAFTLFKIHLDKSREDYDKRCQQNKANASKRKRTLTNDANININKNMNNTKWKGIDE